MVTINKLYKTQIDCSTYEPQIDSTNTEITITVKDYNNQAVENANVSVVVDRGYFNSYVRNSTTTSISGTSTKSYNGVTGTNGTFSLRYTAEDWGFINVSAGNNNVKLYATGFRTIPLVEDLNYQSWGGDEDPFKHSKTFYYDDSISIAVLKLQYNNKFQKSMYPNGYTFSGSTEEVISSLILNCDESSPSQSLDTDSGGPAILCDSDSNIPRYTMPSTGPINVWYRPDIVRKISSKGIIAFRSRMEEATPADKIWVYHEWSYLRDGVVE